MARLGLHPRLARALLDGAPEAGVRRAAEVVALLSEEPPRAYGDDLAAAWRTARRGGDAYGARWRQEARRLASAAGGPRGGSGVDTGAGGGRGAGEPLSDDAVAGLVAALAFPERVARARGAGSYLMASGTGAELAGAGAQAGWGHRPGSSGAGDGSGLRDAPWLAVAVADRPVAAASARVRLAAVIDEETACAAAPALYASGEEVRWSDGDVVARRVTRLGAIELAARPLTAPDPGLLRDAVVSGLRREGLGLLRWPAAAASLRQRMAFVHRELGAPWPDVSDAALLESVEEWLGVEIGRARRRADLERIDAGQALARLLPWASGDAVRFDELAPERIEVPSGSRVRVDYGGAQPVLAVKLQELFGWQESPRVAGGRVPVLVHLLSPAGRPAAVTADLASFWRDGYRSVRAELRGRYPKHPWPEDPSTAEPTRHTSARLKRG